ncbi:hypothetical protein [Acidocella sp.]|uniref:hypothetical protein n=1 Tax=Acidocella sp. TaxID=50710 RepID=UPI00344DF790
MIARRGSWRRAPSYRPGPWCHAPCRYRSWPAPCCWRPCCYGPACRAPCWTVPCWTVPCWTAPCWTARRRPGRTG